MPSWNTRLTTGRHGAHILNKHTAGKQRLGPTRFAINKIGFTTFFVAKLTNNTQTGSGRVEKLLLQIAMVPSSIHLQVRDDMDTVKWVGRFKGSPNDFVVFDPDAQKNLPNFVLLYLVLTNVQQEFVASAVKLNLLAIKDEHQKHLAILAYESWKSSPPAPPLVDTESREAFVYGSPVPVDWWREQL